MNAFFVPAGILCTLGVTSVPSQSLRFQNPPTAQLFSDGALEWSGTVSCSDPAALLGARVVFSLDANLDGEGDVWGDTAETVLSPADCDGDRLTVHRGFFPATPAVLRAELHSARAGISGNLDSITDVHSMSTGGLGALLTLRRFCARPKNGEPEWIEIRNASTIPVSLAKTRLEGRALSGSLNLTQLESGDGFTAMAAGDTAEMRLWQPGARLFPLSSWPSLRNSGDTLRISVDVKARDGSVASIVLDSVIYGSGSASREACASLPTEESGGGAFGFELEMPPGRWKRRAGVLKIGVIAPSDSGTAVRANSRYDLRVYNLDGLELCALARGAEGPQTFTLSASTCGRLSASATAALIQLQPRHSQRGAPSIRRLLWIVP